MIVLCTKCGGKHDLALLTTFHRCTLCGDLFANQHLHIETTASSANAAALERERIELSPPPYPPEPSLYPKIVPAPRPVDDTSRASWRRQIANLLNPTARIDFEQHQFVPCDTCAAKPGAPTLCAGCLANRQTVDELNEIAELADKLAKKTIAARKRS